LNSLSNAGIGRVALQSPGYNRVSFPSRQPVFGNSNPVVAAAKSLYPDTVFTFGGINHYPASELSPQEFSRDLVEQLTNLEKSGFDGIKLIETKTAFYIDYPYKLFDDVFADFFSELSRLQMPVMWHVGDPAVFWDPENVPSGAREQGWFYGTDEYPTLEELHESTIEILDDNPGLKVIFAHFFYMSDRLEKLGDLLDRYPSIYVDVTPGVEIYRDFSLNRADAYDFFVKYPGSVVSGCFALVKL
jgi:predicted TIM-barrel fold metal-dependent hydrolase